MSFLGDSVQVGLLIRRAVGSRRLFLFSWFGLFDLICFFFGLEDDDDDECGLCVYYLKL